MIEQQHDLGESSSVSFEVEDVPRIIATLEELVRESRMLSKSEDEVVEGDWSVARESDKT